jgi:hypothetical protein
MVKQFLTKKHAKESKKKEHAKKENKKLRDFYSEEQTKREKIQSVEEQIFEHLKEHTKKVLKKK